MGKQDEGTDEIIVTEGSTDLETIKAALLTGEITLEVDPAVIARQIVEQIIMAPSVEAAFKERPVWHAAAVTGQSFELRDVRWFPSSFDNGPALFAAVDAVSLETGEVGIFTTSAFKQLAKLYVLARDGAFPRKVTNTTTLRATAGGFYPLDFEDVLETAEA